MLKTFNEVLNEKVEIIRKTLADISEDRRKWLRLRVANSFLFGAGASFFHYKRAPKKNEALLNHAIAMRATAAEFYQDEEERQAADAEGVVRYYSPKPPIKIERKKGEREVPDTIKKMMAEAAKKVALQNIQREKILPDLEGFLDGAKYKEFDLQPSEFDADQAHDVVRRAFEKMDERIEQDLVFHAVKWVEASQNDDDNACALWQAESFLATEDKKLVQAVMKQYNFK